MPPLVFSLATGTNACAIEESCSVPDANVREGAFSPYEHDRAWAASPLVLSMTLATS